MKKILLLGILTLVFKDITFHSDVRLVMQILKQTEKVQNLVFREGERNRIVYEGSFEGETEPLARMLEESINKRLEMETRPTPDGIEILLQPPSSE